MKVPEIGCPTAPSLNAIMLQLVRDAGTASVELRCGEQKPNGRERCGGLLAHRWDVASLPAPVVCIERHGVTGMHKHVHQWTGGTGKAPARRMWEAWVVTPAPWHWVTRCAAGHTSTTLTLPPACPRCDGEVVDRRHRAWPPTLGLSARCNRCGVNGDVDLDAVMAAERGSTILRPPSANQ